MRVNYKDYSALEALVMLILPLFKFFSLAKRNVVLLAASLLISTAACGQQKAAAGLSYSSPFYPVLAWNGVDPNLPIQDIGDANFTIAGFVQPSELPRFKKSDLKVIFGSISNDPWRTLSGKEIDHKVKKLIGNTANNNAVIGYFITDEPSALDFRALGKAVEAVKKYAPGKLAYINLFPNYATVKKSNGKKSQLGTKTYAAYLERYVKEVKPQFISYDNYMVQYSMDLKVKKKALSYYKNLLAVRRVALKYHLPYWNIISSNQIRDYTPGPSLENMLFQAYTSLAAGYKGISWYTYTTRHSYKRSPVNDSYHKTSTWRYVKKVNRQILALAPIMDGLTSTGVYFTSPAPDKSLPQLPGKVIQSLQSKEPMMVGEFTSEKGTRYAMIVNLSLTKPADVTFTSKKEIDKAWTISTGTAKDKKPVESVLKNKHNSRLKKKLKLKPGEGILIGLEY